MPAHVYTQAEVDALLQQHTDTVRRIIRDTLMAGAGITFTHETDGRLTIAATPPPPPPAPVGISVKDYGAEGDGNTVDGAAIQAAFDAALATTHRTVRVPTGVYLISAPLRYDSIKVVGDGKDQSIIRNTTTRTDTATLMATPRSNGVQNAGFFNVGFDQRSDWYDRNQASWSSPCFDIGGTVNLTLEDCAFFNARTIAVWCDVPTANTVGATIRRCRIYQAESGGISLFGSMRDLLIEENHITNTQDDAIAFQDRGAGHYPSNCVARGNVIEDCTGRSRGLSTPRGIIAYGANRITIEHNIIRNVLASGVLVSQGSARRSTNITVRNNHIRDIGLTNNYPDGVPSYGVFIIGADGVFLADNNIANARHGAYEVRNSTNVQGIPTATNVQGIPTATNAQAIPTATAAADAE